LERDLVFSKPLRGFAAGVAGFERVDLDHGMWESGNISRKVAQTQKCKIFN
jgi:hypothetical protein